MTKYITLGFLNEDARIRLRVDAINVFDYKNFTNYNGNARDVVDDANGVFGKPHRSRYRRQPAAYVQVFGRLFFLACRFTAAVRPSPGRGSFQLHKDI